MVYALTYFRAADCVLLFTREMLGAAPYNALAEAVAQYRWRMAKEAMTQRGQR